MKQSEKMEMRAKKVAIIEEMFEANPAVTVAEIDERVQKELKVMVGNRLVGPLLEKLKGQKHRKNGKQEAKAEMKPAPVVQEKVAEQVMVPKDVHDAILELRKLGGHALVRQDVLEAAIKLFKVMRPHGFDSCDLTPTSAKLHQMARDITV